MQVQDLTGTHLIWAAGLILTAYILRFLLSCAIRFEENLGQMRNGTANQTESNYTTPKKPDEMKIPIRIHHGNADPKSHVLVVNKSADCSELNAAISSEIGSENYTVIASGHKMNFTSEPQQPIEQLGVNEGKTLIVQRHSTLESVGEDALKQNSKTAVANELRIEFCCASSASLASSTSWCRDCGMPRESIVRMSDFRSASMASSSGASGNAPAVGASVHLFLSSTSQLPKNQTSVSGRQERSTKA